MCALAPTQKEKPPGIAMILIQQVSPTVWADFLPNTTLRQFTFTWGQISIYLDPAKINYASKSQVHTASCASVARWPDRQNHQDQL
jgi:hypothetical protein